MNVDQNGKITIREAKLPEEPKVNAMTGSPIEATAGKVAEMTNQQAAAVQNLGGKISGGKRRRRGGANVEIKGVPNFVSAGSVDAKNMYADLLKLNANATTGATYDNLGNAPPAKVGGKRKSKKRSFRKSRRTRRRKTRR